MGTAYESKDKEYISADGLKTMTVDAYGQVNISIQDGFGNTLISKDEAAGTWTESTYEYGSEDNGGSENEETEDDVDEEKEETSRLLEEKTYTFEPDEKKFIVNENGETVANFYMTGKGSELLSGSKKLFMTTSAMRLESAEFMNGELDKTHCTSFHFSKSETEVIRRRRRGTDDYHRL